MPEKKAAPGEDVERDPGYEKKEGGPLERQRAFARQRAAVLRPRGEASPPEQPATPDAHKKAMAEYRKRQKPSPRPGKKQSEE